MAVDHYENFPVASVLLPKRLRRPVEIIYNFARQADDFADEGDAPNEERLAKLDGFRAELDRNPKFLHNLLPDATSILECLLVHLLFYVEKIYDIAFYF